jgi:SAM-dependent methyltransferase
MSSAIAPANDEAIRAWDGPLFDRFVEYRDLLVASLGEHGRVAMDLHPPAEGARVLDIGCGFGDTTQDLARLVGPGGSAVGLDCAPRFISTAEAENAEPNCRFMVADLQAHTFSETFDYAYSRMGTMFFANPVVALRNVAAALAPGGQLVMVVWRRREDNECFYRPERIVKRHLEKPDDSEEPTCGPGPFSMAGADTVSDVLQHAGFTDVTLRRNDLDVMIGDNLQRAIDLVLAIGPGGEVVRLLGDRADHALPQIRADLEQGMAEFVTEDGRLLAPSSTWIVSATKP